MITDKWPRRPEPFQFGLKHLLFAPVVIAALFALLPLIGVGWTVVIAGVVLGSLPLMLRSWVEGLTFDAIVLIVLGLLSLGSGRAGSAARRMHCTNNLKQLGLALHNYHDTYGCFPPAYIADENGRPMHSWRVLILPFLEQQHLYDQYRFDEPWDGPNNRKLHDVIVSEFWCPAEEESTPATSYLAVVGPGTAWPGSEPVKLGDVKDGASKTILLVEVADSGIHWMEPRDLHVVQMAPAINAPAGQGTRSRHYNGANVVLVDGRVWFLSETVTGEGLRAMLTIAGGEDVDPGTVNDPPTSNGQREPAGR